MTSYPLYPDRDRATLDGLWDFCWAGEDCELGALRPDTLGFNEVAAVPGVFDTALPCQGRRGIGVYRCAVRYPAGAGTALRLRIGGLGPAGKVWWNGADTGTVPLPYSEAVCDVTAADGHNELVIAVDNRFGPERSPLFGPHFDFYAYGGIYRSVTVERLPACRLERAEVTTLDLEEKRVRIRVRLGGTYGKTVDVSLAFDDGPSAPHACRVEDGTATIETTVPDGKPWTPETPVLHHARLSISGDRLVERFGLRTIGTRGRTLLLNGRPFRLRGVCRHESHPAFGPVQPAQLLCDDVQLIRDLGANYVRGVHYPLDPRFLDLCDRVGLLVWEESLSWNCTEQEARDQRFRELQIRQTRAMAQRSINHPSLILRGVLNEGCTDTTAGRELCRDLLETIRDCDPSRLVTFASNRLERDICFDLVDVISVNLYPGWFGVADWEKTTAERIAPRLREMTAWLEQPAHAHKPVLVSEIGVCSLYGCHDRALAQWSEEFQADYVRESLFRILGDDRYAGVSLWQLFDTRSYVNAGPDVRGKARGFNCAGLLDEYRRPKLAYDAVREAYRSGR